MSKFYENLDFWKKEIEKHLSKKEREEREKKAKRKNKKAGS